MTDELVHYDVDRGVARITLDSPHNRNALSIQLTGELVDRLDRAAADDDVRVIVLGATGPVFCSGADLKEQRERNVRGDDSRPRFSMPEVLTKLWESPKPVIGQVQGHARAGGLGLIGACDIALAVKPATFAFTEVRLGVVPALISVTVLPRLSSRAATENFLTGESFHADRAVEIGLINAAVDEAILESEVDRYAAMLAKGGPEALRHTKQLLRRVPTLPIAQAFEEMAALSADRFASLEAREGMTAFAEKRDPSWVPPA
jgi:methylglutaconyl-CoA hydratase